mgnify:CR=1 FL=1
MKLGKPDYGEVNLEGWDLPEMEQEFSNHVAPLVEAIAESLSDKLPPIILHAAKEAIQIAAEEGSTAFFTTEDGVKLDVCLKLDNGFDDCGPTWKIDIKDVLEFMFDDLPQEEKESITSYFYDLAKWLAAKTIQPETQTEGEAPK